VEFKELRINLYGVTFAAIKQIMPETNINILASIICLLNEKASLEIKNR